MNTNSRIEVNSRKEAWAMVDKIFPTDYIKDEVSSAGAGYPIYRSTAEGHFYDYICDLNDRLEVNLSNGKTVNIWFSTAYIKYCALREEKQELLQKVDDLQSEIDSLKFMLDLYQKSKDELVAQNAELKAQNEELEAKVVKMWNALHDIYTISANC